MFRAKKFQDTPHPSVTPPPAPSHALEWLWQYLHDEPRPPILDCGPVCQATLEVLLRRRAKVYVADLVTPARRATIEFVARQDKKTAFHVDELLATLPPIPAGSLSAIACWHLLDLLPREALSNLIAKLWSLLRPGGVLFCLLREPYLTQGADTRWWFDSLMALGSSHDTKVPFPCPALTNRELERLIPAGAVKTFLTRSARRETLVMK